MNNRGFERFFHEQKWVRVSNGDGSTNLTPEAQLRGHNKAASSFLISCFNTTNDGTVAPMLGFMKSGNGVLGENTIVASAEVLGEIVWFGADGADFESPAARIQCIVDTTPGAGDMPGALIFSTTADGGETLTEAMRITSSQDVRFAHGFIIGSTTAQVTISNGDGATNLIPEVQFLGAAKAAASVLIASFNTTDDTTVAPSLNFLKSGNATIGSNTVVASGEVLGEVNFFGADGTDFESCAVSIRGLANAAAGTGDMPGRLSIFTSTDGAETPTERARITGTATASTLALGIAGATTGTLTMAGTTSGVVTIQALAAAGTYTLSLPPDDGDAGEQLQTDGSGVMTWEAAASRREVKNILDVLDEKANEALARMLAAPVYAFQYKPGARGVGGDYETVYHGVIADEYPQVMQHEGRIFNPISAFGECVLAIKALASRIAALETTPAPIQAAPPDSDPGIQRDPGIKRHRHGYRREQQKPSE